MKIKSWGKMSQTVKQEKDKSKLGQQTSCGMPHVLLLVHSGEKMIALINMFLLLLQSMLCPC